ncbi:MAG: tetratricopeptide repeat protein, partial [Acidobacteriota bacterium]|nr:tetratricopeptide repeat protein [Acidobacteriota bacterium]
QRNQAELAAFHLEAARRAYDREADREAEGEVRRALFLTPYLTEAHVMLGRILLREGRANEAVQALTIAIWGEDTSDAEVLLAEASLVLGDTGTARVAVDRALRLDPDSTAAAALKARLPSP